MLACDITIKILGEANHWFMDGTFKSSPDQLEQVYSIHGRIDGYFLSFANILMQGKEEKTYREAFVQLKDIAATKNVHDTLI